MHTERPPNHRLGNCELETGGRSEAESREYEEEHVHDIYQQIASHFSSTRYKVCAPDVFHNLKTNLMQGIKLTSLLKPWPIVERFLNGFPDGSIGLDVGCGNGKYLGVNSNVFIVASDRSEALVKIAAKHEPHSALVADILTLPHPPSSFDFAISIAVIHHLSTTARRVQAIATILETLRLASGSSAKALIYVWALEQQQSRRGWSEKDEQDVMVPWVMNGASVGSNDAGTKTFHRYYHLYRSGELERDISVAGGTVLEAGYEKDNWWAIATKNSDDTLHG